MLKVKVAQAVFSLKIYAFKISKNITKYLCYFCMKICRQELLKIVQFGHAGNHFSHEVCKQIIVS